MGNVLSSAVQLALCIGGVVLICVPKSDIAGIAGWVVLAVGAVLILRYARASAIEDRVQREKFANVRFEERQKQRDDEQSGPWSA